MTQRAIIAIENIATITLTSATVIGMAAFGMGGWSLFGFLILLNCTSATAKTEASS